MEDTLKSKAVGVNGSTEEERKLPKMVTGWTKLENRLFWQGRYLTANAKWIYATLRSFMNNDTGRTFPSYDAIVERSGLSRPKVAEGLRELEYFNWIAKHKRFSKSTNYTVSYPIRFLDKSKGLLHPDQTSPTKEEAVAWASELREKRKAKDERRKIKRGWKQAREAIEKKRITEMEEDDIPF
jgi:DNA-binding transcriptional regulator GbsR (MarR family)